MQPLFTFPSYAKVNLYLRILGKREDGFHELCTVFQTISLHDNLSFSESDSIRLTCSDQSIPVDGRNLIVRAAEALRMQFSVNKGAAIHLDKHIPSPGGLGGGSSNAAVALLGLKRLWQMDVSDVELHAITAELGSDVPFFLHGGTALGIGRGETIELLDDLDQRYLLVVTPNISVSTTAAFAAINAESLTSEAQNRILRVCRDEARSLDLHHSVLKNDFETSVLAAFPEIAEIKANLLALGASKAQMSGSGASVFGIFDKEETRQAAIKALGDKPTWRSFAVATVSRSQYRDELCA